MPNMPTLAEALEAADLLRRFLDGIGQVFRAGGAESSKPTHSRAKHLNSRVPRTMKDRVLAILREVGRPLRPVEITDEYMNRGWPTKGKTERKLSNLIRSTLAFLKKQNKVIHDEESGQYGVAP